MNGKLEENDQQVAELKAVIEMQDKQIKQLRSTIEDLLIELQSIDKVNSEGEMQTLLAELRRNWPSS